MLMKSEKTCALDAEANQIKDLFDSDEMKNMCPNCNKQNKTSGGIKRHFKKRYTSSLLTLKTNCLLLERTTLRYTEHRL